MELPWYGDELAISEKRVGGLRGGDAKVSWASGRLARIREMRETGCVLITREHGRNER